MFRDSFVPKVTANCGSIHANDFGSEMFARITLVTMTCRSPFNAACSYDVSFFIASNGSISAL